MDPKIEKKHLLRPTTFRAYHEGRLGRIEELPDPLRKHLLEEERAIAQRLVGDFELWEWEMTGEEVGHCSGLAVVRAGEIVVHRMCYRVGPAGRAAPPGTTTAPRFFEGGTPAGPGKLQRSTFRSLVRTPLRPEGVAKTLVVDPAAPTTDTEKPAFMAPPPGSPAYTGYPLVEETRRGGWCLGAVTDPFEPDGPEGCTVGDLFVEAPDGTRAGLVWNVDPQSRFSVIEPGGPVRWGLFHFTFPRPIKEMSDLVAAFEGALPVLQQLHAGFHAGLGRG
jgi:hypothetical protein